NVTAAINAKNIDELKEIIKKLSKIKENAEKVKNSATSKHYSAKETEAQALITDITKSIKEAEDALKEAEQSEQDRIDRVKAALQKAAQDLLAKKQELDGKTKYDEINLAVITANTELESAKNVLNLHNNVKNQGIPALKTELDALDQAIKDTNSSITSAKQKAEDIKEAHDNLYNTFKTGNYKTATQAAKDAGTDETKLKAALKLLEDAKTEAETLKANATNVGYLANNTQIVADIAELDRLITEVKNNLQSEQQRIDDVLNTLNDAIRNLNNKIAEAGNYSNKYNSLSNYVEQLKTLKDTSLGIYTTNNTTQNKAVLKLKEKLEELDTSIKNANQKIQDINTWINTTKQTHDTAYQSWKDAEFKQAKEADKQSGNSIEKIKNAISAYESALAKLETIKTAANAQEYHINDGLMNQNKTEIETALANLRAKLQSEQQKEDKRVEDLKKLLQGHINAIDAAKTAAEAQKEKIDPLDQNLGALVNAISNARPIYNANKDDKNPEAKELARQLGELINSANTIANDLKNKLIESKRAIDTPLSTIDTNVKKAIKEAKDAGDNIAKLDKVIQDLNKEKDNLDKLKLNIQQKVYKEASDKADVLLEQIKEALKEAQKQKNAEETRIREIIEKIKELMEANKTHSETAKLAKDNYDELSAKLPTFKNSIAEMSNLYTNTTAQDIQKIGLLDDQIWEDFKNTITSSKMLENELNNNLKDIKETAERKLNTAQNKWSDIKTSVESALAQNKINLLEKAKADLEALKFLAEDSKNYAAQKKYSAVESSSKTLIETIDEKLESIKNKLEAKNKRIQDILAKINGVTTEIARTVAEVEKHKLKVDPLEKAIPDLEKVYDKAKKLLDEINADADLKDEAQIRAALITFGADVDNTRQKIASLKVALEANKKQFKDIYDAAVQVLKNLVEYELSEWGNSGDITKISEIKTKAEQNLNSFKQATAKAESLEYKQAKIDSLAKEDEVKELIRKLTNLIEFEGKRKTYLDKLNAEANEETFFIYKKERQIFKNQISILKASDHTEDDMKVIYEQAKIESKQNQEVLQTTINNLNNIFKNVLVFKDMPWESSSIKHHDMKIAIFTRVNQLLGTRFSHFAHPGLDLKQLFRDYNENKNGRNDDGKDEQTQEGQAIQNLHDLIEQWDTYLNKLDKISKKHDQIKAWTLDALNIQNKYTEELGAFYSPLITYFDVLNDIREIDGKRFHNFGPSSENYSKFYGADGYVKLHKIDLLGQMIEELDLLVENKKFYKIETKAEWENYLKPFVDRQNAILEEIWRLHRVRWEYRDHDYLMNKHFKPFFEKFKNAQSVQEQINLHKELVIDKGVIKYIENTFFVEERDRAEGIYKDILRQFKEIKDTKSHDELSKLINANHSLYKLIFQIHNDLAAVIGSAEKQPELNTAILKETFEKFQKLLEEIKEIKKALEGIEKIRQNPDLQIGLIDPFNTPQNKYPSEVQNSDVYTPKNTSDLEFSIEYMSPNDIEGKLMVYFKAKSKKVNNLEIIFGDEVRTHKDQSWQKSFKNDKKSLTNKDYVLGDFYKMAWDIWKIIFAKNPNWKTNDIDEFRSVILSYPEIRKYVEKTIYLAYSPEGNKINIKLNLTTSDEVGLNLRETQHKINAIVGRNSDKTYNYQEITITSTNGTFVLWKPLYDYVRIITEIKMIEKFIETFDSFKDEFETKFKENMKTFKDLFEPKNLDWWSNVQYNDYQLTNVFASTIAMMSTHWNAEKTRTEVAANPQKVRNLLKWIKENILARPYNWPYFNPFQIYITDPDDPGTQHIL
ncbi:hypothetical protein OF364_02155, partial [Mycoplasma enhydrae]|uniref:hypothetical protein n=1 Tax=Mycoplasma enhydrae TaxID=2499220 RepID=UPI0021E9AE5E